MSDFTQLGEQIGNLVAQKQEAYGDSYGKSGEVLKVLYPNGVRVDQYPAFLAVTRVIDKLFRVATKKDAFGESPWRDIAGYALLGIASDEKQIQAPAVKVNTASACQEMIDDVKESIKESIEDYCRRKQIRCEVPADDAEVDLMGLRVIKGSCCGHPERGICDGGESDERICDPRVDGPPFEFVEDEPPIGAPRFAPFKGKEVCY